MMPTINFDNKVLKKHNSSYFPKTNSLFFIVYGLVFVLLLLVNRETFAQISGVPDTPLSETFTISGAAPISISITAGPGAVSPAVIGGTLSPGTPVTGSFVYSYTIPLGTPAGQLPLVTIASTPFNSTSPIINTVLITVLPPPTTNTTPSTTNTTPPLGNLAGTILQTPCEALQQSSQPLSPGQTDLLNTCYAISGLTPSQAAGAISQLTPVQVTAQSTLALTASNQQFRNVFNRIMLLRHGAKGVDVSGLNLRSNGQAMPVAFLNSLVPGHTKGGGASSDQESPFDKFGVFVNGNFSMGDKNRTNQELGFDFNSQGVTAGIDYRFSDNFVMGTAFGYNGTNSGFDQSRGGVNIDGYNFSLYSTYYVKDFYVDGMLTGGWNAYNTSRQINFGTINQTGQGNTRGNEYAANLSAGYEFHYKSFTAGPYGRVSYQNNQIDSYQEKSTVPLSTGYGSLLSIGSQSAQSTRTALGGQFSYAVSTKHGVFTPTARAEWLHEYNNGSRLINAQFINDPTNTTFAISSDNPARNFFNLGTGLSATLAHGASAFMYYEAMVGNNNLTQHSISAGIRSEF